MTKAKRLFISFKNNDTTSDSITVRDNSLGKVLGHGKIAITTEHSISKVLPVESFDYNLLSVSQLCEMDYNCLFTNKRVIVLRRSDGSFAFKGVLREENFTLWTLFPRKWNLTSALLLRETWVGCDIVG
jgi:hypothetical protein